MGSQPAERAEGKPERLGIDFSLQLGATHLPWVDGRSAEAAAVMERL